MSALNKFFTRVVSQTREKATASLIFLHGSGDTGVGIQNWVDTLSDGEFSFPHMRVLYPTAPARPYTPSMGAVSTVWYDRKQISPFAPDDESVDEMAQELCTLINEEVQRGISLNRIIIGGFSMGGGMSLQVAYRFQQDLAGVFALSSFLAESSKVFEELKTKPKSCPPLFMCHGKRDDLVLYDWGKSTFDKLETLGVEGEFTTYPNLCHEISSSEIKQLRDWLQRIVPENYKQSNM